MVSCCLCAQAAIAAASSSSEIDRLNFFLLQGVLPPELQEAEASGAETGSAEGEAVAATASAADAAMGLD